MKTIMTPLRLALPIFVAFAITLGVWPTTVSAADKPGMCVIYPNQQSKVESLGVGVVTNAKSVCDASAEGCGSCVELCRLFTNINDRFGCPLDGADGFCNPDFQGTDPDCDADRDGFQSNVDCDDSDPFTFPGAPEHCFDEKDNTCTNGLIDEQDPACFPDGFCNAARESYVNTDCIPESGICPGFNERIINDMEASLGALGVLSFISQPEGDTPRCNITEPIGNSFEHHGVRLIASDPANTLLFRLWRWNISHTTQLGQGLQSPNLNFDQFRDVGVELSPAEAADCHLALLNACGF